MPAVFLKADDLRLEIVTDKWKQFLTYCVKEDVYCNVGVIVGGAVNLDETRIPGIRAELESLGMGKAWTLWNHGVDHKRREVPGTCDFRGVPLAQQVRALRVAQEVVEKIVGFRMEAFGPPFNAWDHMTLLALQQVPDIRCVFYIPYVPGKECYGSEIFVEPEPYIGIPRPGGKRTFSLETAKRKSERFLKIGRSFVLQVHPNSWDERAFDAFVSFVAYIKSAGYTFERAGRPVSGR